MHHTHQLQPLSLHFFFSQWWRKEAFWCISTDDKLLLQIKKKKKKKSIVEKCQPGTVMKDWTCGNSDNAENVSRRARGVQPDR